MMNRNRLRVSLVIPAYNEESHLAACLDAVAKQTVMPFEVIVVDNNSIDQTAAVARSYPFVRVVHESRQGVVYARDAGFNAARGDIIGRIDVDTLLSPTWIKQVQAEFSSGEVDAVSGSIRFYDIPFEPFFASIELFCRRYIARNLAKRNELFLYGSNMALRRSVWAKMRDRVCHEPALHEDIDLAAHFAHTAYRLKFDDTLSVHVSARRIDSKVRSYYYYVMANSRTYAAHSLKGRFYMYPVELLVLVFYPPLRMMYRSYNPQTGKFSLRRMVKPDYHVRVSPVADVL